MLANQAQKCEFCIFSNNTKKNYCDKCMKNRDTNEKTIFNNNSIKIDKIRMKPLRVDKSSELRLKSFRRLTNSNENLAEENNQDHFIDNEFPPNKKSIYDKKSIFPFKKLLQVGGLKKAKYWLRPNEVNFSSDDSYLPISLYHNNSTPKDVVQGGVGSCWFISALSIIAERPELLSNILMTKSYNSNGLHQIRLCKRGQWVTVNIDDYLPCDKNGKILFAYAKHRQFWVSFIEKALAKLYGNYESIASGACVEGLQTLTGEPCEIVYLENTDTNLDNRLTGSYEYTDRTKLWKKLLNAKQSGYLMTTLCFNKNLSFVDLHKVGLFNRHIYSVLDVREFNYDNKIINLLKLRNPWGKKEWKGDWSNKWPNWPSEIKSQVTDFNTKNDGCFWLSFDDLLKYFYDISICKVRTDWFESRHSSFFYDHSDGAQVFLLNINEPGEHLFEFELFANGRKHGGYNRNDDPNIDLCLIVCKINDPSSNSGLTCIAFEHNVEYFINLSSSLTQGCYLIFATSFRAISNLIEDRKLKKKPNFFSYNLVIHGQTKFDLNITGLSSATISDIFYSVAKKSNRVREELNGNVRTLIIPGSCIHGIIVENLSTDFFVRITLDLTESKNLVSTRFSNISQDFLAPKTRQFICYLTPNNYRKGFVIGYKIETHIAENITKPGNYPLIPLSYLGLHSVRQVY